MRDDSNPLVGVRLRDLLSRWRVAPDNDIIVPVQLGPEPNDEYRHYRMAVLVQALADLEVGWDYKQGHVIGTTTYIDGSPALRAKELPELETWFLSDAPTFWRVSEWKAPRPLWGHDSRQPKTYEKLRFAVEYSPEDGPFSFPVCCEALGIRTGVARRAVERWLALRRSGKRAQFGVWRHRRLELENESC